MSNPKLPKHVAAAIASLRAAGRHLMLYDIERIKHESIYGGNTFKDCHPIYEYYRDNKKDYFSALVNGYEIETTPEQDVSEYYKHIASLAAKEDKGSYAWTHLTGKIDGVETAIKLLGIEIEGVNA